MDTREVTTDDSVHLAGCTDAMVWAREFVRIFDGERVGHTVDDKVDEGLMVGWFANAMMAEHDSVSAAEVVRRELGVRRALARHDLARWRELFVSWVGRKLPRELRYFTTIGMMAEATTRPELREHEVPGVRIQDLLPVLGHIARR